MRNKCIGVFDSGFGGLTVLKGLRSRLSGYDYIYLGDTARSPYGSRNQKEIYEFTKQAVDLLFLKNCELIILACNTASSEALRKIQQEYLPKNYPTRRVLGVVIPACEEATSEGHRKIGIMATESTVSSCAYIRELGKLDKNIEIRQVACPDLALLIESGQLESEELEESLEKYLSEIADVDAIILGCTHYEIIEKSIRRKAGKIKIISQSSLVAEKLADYFNRHPEIEKKLSKNKSTILYSTDDAKRFQNFARKIIGEDIGVDRIEI